MAPRLLSLALALALALLALALSLAHTPTSTSAHALCRTSFAPVTVTSATYAKCPSYSSSAPLQVCITPAQEASKLPALPDTGSATCNARLRLASCAAIDGWSAHLYRTCLLYTSPSPRE